MCDKCFPDEGPYPSSEVSQSDGQLIISGGALVRITGAWADTMRDLASSLNVSEIPRVIKTLDDIRFVLAERWQRLATAKEGQ